MVFLKLFSFIFHRPENIKATDRSELALLRCPNERSGLEGYGR